MADPEVNQGDFKDSPLKTQAHERNPFMNQEEEQQPNNPMNDDENQNLMQQPMPEPIQQRPIQQEPIQQEPIQQEPIQQPIPQPLQYPMNQGLVAMQIPQGLTPMQIPQVGYVQQYLPQSLEEAMQSIQIPDLVSFEHTLKFKDACCESIEISEISEIPGLGNGQFKVGGHLRSCKCSIPIFSCLCRPRANCCSFCDCLYCLRCDYEYSHLYKGPLYTISNEMIRFEHFGLLSKVFVRNVLALEIYESDYNNADIFYGACRSNYPHLIIKNPNFIGNKYIYFEPQPNDCPEHPCAYIPGTCIFCSWIGIKQLFRSINITFQYDEDLNKLCRIQTRRTTKQACKIQCGCSEDVIDYPNTEIKFSSSINQIERLGIVMASIHHSIFNRWVQYGWLGKLYTNIPQFYMDELEF